MVFVQSKYSVLTKCLEDYVHIEHVEKNEKDDVICEDIPIEYNNFICEEDNDILNIPWLNLDTELII